MRSQECKLKTYSNSCIKLFPSIYTCHDDAKDKEFELELSWICAESQYKHQFVPAELKAEAERLAKESSSDDEMED